ncbi:MAG: heparan-alpha-glucosaminide N-acetyltransferase domain-containing protein [Crocosphaera sp.]|nr:heparan-alpha-glucosaminide N-acetyltransferase domain-containing protein [Crocosphaera sp.]
MLTAQNSLSENFHWYELDILRGLAAILMIVNHVGYAILSPELTTKGMSGLLIFIGSFAPVLFFFITGVGSGIQSRQEPRKNYWSGVLYKVFVLVVADQFFYWNKGSLLGINFLGFIGFSTLVIAWIRRSQHSAIFAFAGLIIISSLRYLIAPIMQSFHIDNGLLIWILGQPGIQDISYPMSPWLAYPFAGYLIGYTAVRYGSFRDKHPKKSIIIFLILSFFPAALTLILLQIGSSLHRWGTVAIGFYVISFSIILISLSSSLACVQFFKSQNIKNFISLRGISSLIVVPIHYYLIFLLKSVGLNNLNFIVFTILTIFTIVLSFFISKSISKWSKFIKRTHYQSVVSIVLISLTIVTAMITFVYAPINPFLSMFGRTCGQVLLSLLFVMSK